MSYRATKYPPKETSINTHTPTSMYIHPHTPTTTITDIWGEISDCNFELQLLTFSIELFSGWPNHVTSTDSH